jgi:hypothetical protein
MTFEHWDRLAGIVLEGGASDFPGGVQGRREGRVCVIEAPLLDRHKRTQ